MKNNLQPAVLAHAMSQSASAILVTDTSGKILYVNPRFSALTGYSTEEVLGENPRIMQSGETTKETYEAMWGALQSGNSWHGEVRNRRKNGSLYWSSLTVAPVKNEQGETFQYIGIQEDISEQKNLFRQLAAANAELVKSNEDMKRFTSILSHDLKGPLGSMISGLSILEENLQGEGFIRDVGLKIARSAKGLAQRSLDLVTELVSYVRSGAQGTGHEDVDLNRVVDLVKENIGSYLHGRNAEVIVRDLPRIHSNRTLLTLIFQNLIENGVKYCTDPHPRVVISAVRRNSAWVLSVADNGVGISADDKDKLFNPFIRLEKVPGVRGTGLGLATCKRIADLFGGEIWVESEEGKGSEFKFTIPDAPIDDGSESPQQRTEKP